MDGVSHRVCFNAALFKAKGHGEALPASPWPINAGTMAPTVPSPASMVLWLSANLSSELQLFRAASQEFCMRQNRLASHQMASILI